MKRFTFSIFLFSTVLYFGCSNNEPGANNPQQTMDKIIIHFPSDTTNYTDQYNRKQGMWININSPDSKPTLYKNDTAVPYTDSTLQDLIKMLNSKP